MVTFFFVFRLWLGDAVICLALVGIWGRTNKGETSWGQLPCCVGYVADDAGRWEGIFDKIILSCYYMVMLTKIVCWWWWCLMHRRSMPGTYLSTYLPR